MALIKCAECNNDVSDKATLCPKCGAPVKHEATNTQSQTNQTPNTEARKEEPKAAENKTASNATEQPKKTGIAAWKIVVPIVIVLLAGTLLIMFQNNPNAIPGVKLEINTPKPIVVTSRANDGNSTLLKEKTTIYATVQNQGGDGKVLVTFHVFQDGNDYNRSKSIFLSSNESQDLEETFTEVSRLGGEIKYHVEVVAQ